MIMTCKIPGEMWSNELLRHVYEVTWGADINMPQWCGIVTDSLSSGMDCKINFNILNEAWYFFMEDLLKYIGKDDYLFRVWYYNKLKEKNIREEVVTEIAYDIRLMMYAILKDQGCNETDIDETFYDYSD